MSDPFAHATPPTGATPAPDTFIPNGQSADFGRGFGWIGDAFGLFMKAPGAWLLFALVLLLGMMAVGSVPFIGQFLFNLVTPLIFAGVITVCRSLDRGDPLKSEDFLVGFSGNPTPLLIVGGIYMAGSLLIVAVFVIIVIATIGTAFVAALADPNQLADVATMTSVLMILIATLIALALYIPLLMAFWFATPLVYWHNMAPVEAMKASFMGCLKNILPFLLYGVVSFVLLILAMIPLFLGLLVMMPVLMITVYTAYKDIYLKP